MNEEKIARINELYHKSKEQGLSEEEKKSSRCCVKSILLLSREVSVISLLT